VTIDILPDDVLLHIFHFDGLQNLQFRDYELDYEWIWTRDHFRTTTWYIQTWYRLVHVCRRWRSIVFASPNFLHLELVCGPTTRVELTGIWPALPIIIRTVPIVHMPEDYDFNAAIVHVNRVSKMSLHGLSSSQLQRLASAMQEQFPALTHLSLQTVGYSRPAPALPDGFLGGSAPRLRYLELDSIPFPALPNLLLSATDLFGLTLINIPHSGYISPEAIVAALVVLPNLWHLDIEFESPLSRPNQGSRRPQPLTRTALPALTSFFFHGVSEYLEDLVARIDAPLLNSIKITLFHQLIFDIPQFALFMVRTPIFQTFNNDALLDLELNDVRFEQLGHQYSEFKLKISCGKLDWQLSSLAQVLTFFPSLYMVEHLSILDFTISFSSKDIESVQWLEIFQQFTAVKHLSAPRGFLESIALFLQELVEERVLDALPALERLSLIGLRSSGPAQEAIGKFVAARELSGHPVAID
jgi:hypothetical protein